MAGHDLADYVQEIPEEESTNCLAACSSNHFFLVQNESDEVLRVCSETDEDDDSLSVTHFPLLESLDFSVLSVEINASKDLLAVRGVCSVVIIAVGTVPRGWRTSARATSSGKSLPLVFVDEDFFSDHPEIGVVSIKWHPLSDTHLAVTLSDGSLRLYNVPCSVTEPEQIVSLVDRDLGATAVVGVSFSVPSCGDAKAIAEVPVTNETPDEDVVNITMLALSTAGLLAITTCSTGECFVCGPILPRGASIPSESVEVLHRIVEMKRLRGDRDFSLLLSWLHSAFGDVTSMSGLSKKWFPSREDAETMSHVCHPLRLDHSQPCCAVELVESCPLVLASVHEEGILSYSVLLCGAVPGAYHVVAGSVWTVETHDFRSESSGIDEESGNDATFLPYLYTDPSLLESVYLVHGGGVGIALVPWLSSLRSLSLGGSGLAGSVADTVRKIRETRGSFFRLLDTTGGARVLGICEQVESRCGRCAVALVSDGSLHTLRPVSSPFFLANATPIREHAVERAQDTTRPFSDILEEISGQYMSGSALSLADPRAAVLSSFTSPEVLDLFHNRVKDMEENMVLRVESLRIAIQDRLAFLRDEQIAQVEEVHGTEELLDTIHESQQKIDARVRRVVAFQENLQQRASLLLQMVTMMEPNVSEEEMRVFHKLKKEVAVLRRFRDHTSRLESRVDALVTASGEEEAESSSHSASGSRKSLSSSAMSRIQRVLTDEQNLLNDITKRLQNLQHV